jgi:hypothetical protein
MAQPAFPLERLVPKGDLVALYRRTQGARLCLSKLADGHKSHQPMKAATDVANPDSVSQEAFEDTLDTALRSLCRRAICPMSIPATSMNAT